MMAVTIYGVCAVTFMMVMYALERRGRGFVLAPCSAACCRASTGFCRALGPLASSIDLGGRGGSAVRAASRCLNRLRDKIPICSRARSEGPTEADPSPSSLAWLWDRCAGQEVGGVHDLDAGFVVAVEGRYRTPAGTEADVVRSRIHEPEANVVHSARICDPLTSVEENASSTMSSNSFLPLP